MNAMGHAAALLTWRLAVLGSDMNNKQRKTLDAIFTDPLSKTMPWDDIESLLKSIDAGLLKKAAQQSLLRKMGR